MDSIDWSEIHHLETALHSPLFKGIKQKKEISIPFNFDVTLVALCSCRCYQLHKFLDSPREPMEYGQGRCETFSKDNR